MISPAALPRRTVLVGLAALTAGCGAPSAGTAPTTATTLSAPGATATPGAPSTSTTSTPSSATPTTPTTSPTPSAPPTQALPTRAEVVARFAGRQPTQWSNGEFEPMAGLLRRTTTQHVVLTLDACGGPYGSAYDADLIDFLRAERIPAVLFLNKRWIEANRAQFDRFATEQDLFDIGNHGTRHTPLSVTGRSQFKEPGTRDVGEVYDEVVTNHEYLTSLLAPPRYFRTGTAYYDEVALDIVKACGEIPIGFDINGDAGTTYNAATTAKETGLAKAGSIIIGHFNQPKRETYEGMKVALPRLRGKGLTFARLSDCGI